MEKLFLVLVLAGLGLGVWKMFGTKKKTSVNKSTFGGVPYGDNTETGTNDGTIIPPKNGPDAK